MSLCLIQAQWQWSSFIKKLTVRENVLKAVGGGCDTIFSWVLKNDMGIQRPVTQLRVT